MRWRGRTSLSERFSARRFRSIRFLECEGTQYGERNIQGGGRTLAHNRGRDAPSGKRDRGEPCRSRTARGLGSSHRTWPFAPLARHSLRATDVGLRAAGTLDSPPSFAGAAKHHTAQAARSQALGASSLAQAERAPQAAAAGAVGAPALTEEQYRMFKGYFGLDLIKGHLQDHSRGHGEAPGR